MYIGAEHRYRPNFPVNLVWGNRYLELVVFYSSGPHSFPATIKFKTREIERIYLYKSYLERQVLDGITRDVKKVAL